MAPRDRDDELNQHGLSPTSSSRDIWRWTNNLRAMMVSFATKSDEHTRQIRGIYKWGKNTDDTLRQIMTDIGTIQQLLATIQLRMDRIEEQVRDRDRLEEDQRRLLSDLCTQVSNLNLKITANEAKIDRTNAQLLKGLIALAGTVAIAAFGIIFGID